MHNESLNATNILLIAVISILKLKKKTSKTINYKIKGSRKKLKSTLEISDCDPIYFQPASEFEMWSTKMTLKTNTHMF